MKTKFYRTIYILALFSVLFISCSPRILKAPSKGYILYPAPPDTARIQFLTSISGSMQITKKQSTFEKSIVGKNKQQSIIKPYGVFIRNGKIYVSDVSLHGLDIIDLEKKEFKYFVPSGASKLQLVLNSYVDTNNKLYVVDAILHKIAVFDSNGTYLTAFGKSENIKPTAVYIHNNKIYVADSKNNRINVYDKSTYKYEYYFPKSKVGDKSYLYKPANITAGGNKIYVSDMAGEVKIFTLKGVYLSTIGKYGKNIGDFVRPKGIAVDQQENLYVVDGSFENVQVFNKKGQLLMFFGGHYNGPGDMWLPTSIAIDYDNLKYFEKYVDPKYKLEYLIIVANQFGPDKISVYGKIGLQKKENLIK